VIQVDGMRASLYRAQDIKRTSSTISEVIVAEEIGKLPDITAAESVSHLSGIQVERYHDEVNRVLVRGLPDFITTYNGREFFTAELRTARLQDFSSQSIADIQVHKTATAGFIEPGLTGVVNIRTHRPMDFDGEKIAGGISTSYNDQINKSSPNAYFLYSNFWQTQYGAIGFLANMAESSAAYYNGVRYNSTRFVDLAQFDQAYAGLFIPTSVGLYNNGGERKRPSANIAFQWKPDARSEVYFESIYQGFESHKYVDHFMFDLTEPGLNQTGTMLTSIQTNPDNNRVIGLTKSAGRVPFTYRSTSTGLTDTFQSALGANWTSGNWAIKTDLAYTDSTYTDNHWSLDTALSESPVGQIDFNSGGTRFSFEQFNPADINQYHFRGYYEYGFEASSRALQWRMDISYETALNWLQTIEAGIRLTDRDVEIERGSRYAYLLGLETPLNELDFLNFNLTQDPYRGENTGFRQYLAASRSSIQNKQDELAELAYRSLLKLSEQGESWAADEAQNWQTPKVNMNPVESLTGNENTQALYLQGKSYSRWFGVNTDTTLGVRMVQTGLSVSGYQLLNGTAQSELSLTSADSDYINISPNININLHLSDEIIWRLAYTKSLSRTDFINYNPGRVLTMQASASASSSDYTGEGGNPNLKPTLSDNLDTSVEYYFADNGYISGALFYRDISDMPNTTQALINEPDLGMINLTQPENTGQSQILGGEFNVQTFFDLFKPLNGFGISANVTYQDGQTRSRLGAGQYSVYTDIPGLSNWTYNFSVLYDHHQMSARLTYNYRSGWTNWYRDEPEFNRMVENKTQSRSKLDLALSYDFNAFVSGYAYVSNLLAEPLKNYTRLDARQSFLQDIRDEGRYFGLGLRFSY